MPVKVIDASALAAVVFDEPDADRVIDAIDDSSLVPPYLLEFELAIGTRLTTYDASYLWLARALRCELVTLDRRLSAATRR